MIDDEMHQLDVDFGGDLKMTFNLNEWEKNRLAELQHQGVPLQQALGQVKNELRSLGHQKPNIHNNPK